MESTRPIRALLRGLDALSVLNLRALSGGFEDEPWVTDIARPAGRSAEPRKPDGAPGALAP